MTMRGTGAVLDGLKTGHLRWVIVLLCFFSTVINYLDRQVLSVLAPFIRNDLGMSASEYAKIANAYMCGSILGLLVAGPFMDRFGARWGFVIAVVVWSIGGGMTAFATGLTLMMVCRFVLGLGEAGNWPGATKACSEWFPAKERGIAMGFFNGGVSIGAMLSAPAVLLCVWIAGGQVVDVPASDGAAASQSLVPSDAWRSPFLMTALIGIPWIVLWLYFYYSPEKHPRIKPQELELIKQDRILRGVGSGRMLLKTRDFWGLWIARFITSPIWFFIATWLFLYLNKKFGFNLKDMALVAWIPFATADAGNILGGYFSGKMIAGGMRPIRARKIMMLIGAVLMASSFLVSFAETPAVAIALVSFLTFSWGLWVSNMLALASDTFHSKEMGTVISWTSLGQYTGSMLFIWYTGYMVDRYPERGYAFVFATAALLPITGYIFTHFMNKERVDLSTATVPQ